MRTVLFVMLSILTTGMQVNAGQDKAEQQPTTLLALSEAGQTRLIDIQVSVDHLPYDKYWTKTFDALFNFADCNSDGVLSEAELRLVPSARAVRLSLGSAFTPPVASLQSLKEIVADETQKCSREQLKQYYLSHGAGRLQIGSGKLTNTAAITAALIQTLDTDKDGILSQVELQNAETALRRLDTNDDELIGVGELVPNATYPGTWAARALRPATEVDLSSTNENRLVLKQLLTRPADPSMEKSLWQINIADQLADQPLKVATNAQCKSWSVPGPQKELFHELREEIANAAAEPPEESTGNSSRNRRSSRAWLTPLADRDSDGKLSQQEIDRWLELQKQLIHGQLLISVYYGGGLFELLDTNHDAGLSIRELRSAWQILDSASCTSENHADLTRVPNVVLFVVSQGYPQSLARTSTPEVEWFRLMDRNRDGDVSRREFTGSPAAFDRLDQDHDGLISPDEAGKAN
ncbi:EF-hand domain-containing protein [Gimesia algae]|uniref:Transaldolase/EF-hand domain-containing protein n=1 Tax=Gimesia algae TaxID=2527971 RepID=A0A517VL55_9PLAN|nr:EF-hand domain-containing protein [Gimesia algae]QDT93680.1 transaldolase/EF-hand domain-containing protein [Gimesia algae]